MSKERTATSERHESGDYVVTFNSHGNPGSVLRYESQSIAVLAAYYWTFSGMIYTEDELKF